MGTAGKGSTLRCVGAQLTSISMHMPLSALCSAPGHLNSAPRADVSVLSVGAVVEGDNGCLALSISQVARVSAFFQQLQSRSTSSTGSKLELLVSGSVSVS